MSEFDFTERYDNGCLDCCCTDTCTKNGHFFPCFAYTGSIFALLFLLVCFVPFFVGKSEFETCKKNYPDYYFVEPTKSVIVCHWFFHIFGLIASGSIIVYSFKRSSCIQHIIFILSCVGVVASYISYDYCYFTSPEINIYANIIKYDKFIEFQNKLKEDIIDAIVSFSGPVYPTVGIKGSPTEWCFSEPFANRFTGINSTKDLSVFPPLPPRNMFFRVNTLFDIGLKETYINDMNEFIRQGVQCLMDSWRVATGRYKSYCEFSGDKYFGIKDVYDQYYVSDTGKKRAWMNGAARNAAGIFGAGVYSNYMVRSIPIYQMKVVRENINVNKESYECNPMGVHIICHSYKRFHNDPDRAYWEPW